MSQLTKKQALTGLGIFGAVAVVAGAGLSVVISNQAEEATPPPQDYVPTVQDIAHADQHARAFYHDLNEGSIEYLASLKESSVDGEGRIFAPQDGIVKIRSEPATVNLFTFNENKKYQNGSIYSPTGIERHQGVWNAYLKEDFSQKAFDEYHTTLLTMDTTFAKVVVIAPATATYNIASGRICEFKDMIDEKYQQDCYPLKDLTKGSKLAADIEAIHQAYPELAPQF